MIYKSRLILGLFMLTIALTAQLCQWFRPDLFHGFVWKTFTSFACVGLVLVGQYLYWRSPKRAEQYRQKYQQSDIATQDERNRMLRGRSGYFTLCLTAYFEAALMFAFCLAAAVTGQALYWGCALSLAIILVLQGLIYILAELHYNDRL